MKGSSLSITSTRGRRASHTVQPMPAGPPAIDEDTVADLMRAISEARTADDLANVVADLKAWDLGAHKQALQAAWAERSKAIKAQETNQ